MVDQFGLTDSYRSLNMFYELTTGNFFEDFLYVIKQLLPANTSKKSFCCN